MSATLDIEGDWNFRTQEKRLVTVKTKSEPAHKLAALDVPTNLMFTVQVPSTISMDNLAVDSEYLFTLKVYTTKHVDDVDKDFLDFFEAVDVDQSVDDFIKAYWVYPGKVRFLLIEVEEP